MQADVTAGGLLRRGGVFAPRFIVFPERSPRKFNELTEIGDSLPRLVGGIEVFLNTTVSTILVPERLEEAVDGLPASFDALGIPRVGKQFVL